MIAAKHNRTSEPISKLPIDTYSHWFEMALPQASQRQRFFKERIVGKPISHANFRLAHLLSEKRLTTLVVTPNFDDFLPRALTLFGIPHIVCDHPNTVDRIDAESSDIQIVHVHGTYWFYDGCNLRGEIEARTKDSREQSVTMQSLLDNILSRHSPLVIGYAGWEGDAIMTALLRRLKGRLSNNLYWFCYRRSDADSLPDWVKNHRDIRIVVPPATPSKPDSQPSPGTKLAGASAELEPTLSGQSVLDKLVGAFTEQSPALTLDPISFFAAQLAKAFPRDSTEKPGEDIYDLRHVIHRVELVREAGGKSLSPIEAEIERVRDAVRRSSYAEALQTVGGIEGKLLSGAQCERLIESTMSAALGLGDDSEVELEGYELVLRLASDQLKMGPEMGSRVRQQIALALFRKGFVLSQTNRNEEAIEIYNEVLSRFGNATEAPLRERVAKTLYNKGVNLNQLNRHEEAIQTYNELLRRFGDTPELTLREQVAEALINKGIALGQINRGEEEIQAYDEAVRRFGDATESSLREQAAKALINKGIALGQINRGEEEIQAYDEVVRRFVDATEPTLREQVALALGVKGEALMGQNQREKAQAAFQQVLDRFGDASESQVKELVGLAKEKLAALMRTESEKTQ